MADRWPFSMIVVEHGALAFCGLLIYVLVTRIGKHRRHPSAAVSWVLLIAMLPYIGLPLFLLFGTRKYARLDGPVRAPAEGVSRLGAANAPEWATQVLASFGLQPAVVNRAVVFHADGTQSWQALLEVIRGARQSLDLCTFILGNDETGHALVADLAAAAKRGVRVRLLLDAIGSIRASRSGLRGLQEAGATVQWFMPMLHNPLRGRTNLRNHRKAVIADGRMLWSGGRNQAVEYFIDRPGEPAWEDLSFTVEGPLAAQAQLMFAHDWSVASGRGRPLPVAAEEAAAEQAAARQAAVTQVAAARAAAHGDDAQGEGAQGGPGPAAQLVPSGPDHVEDTVYSLLLSSAYRARSRILAASPYFVPDDALLSAWCLACRRGVRLTLLIPRRSNHPLADLARERALRQLAQAGATVLLYPAMMHAKAVVIDDDLALCGTVNLDARSLFLNFELMVAFYGAAEVEWLADWIAQRSRLAEPYDASPPGWWRDLVEGMVRTVGYQL